jgi:hypothetical protein
MNRLRRKILAFAGALPTLSMASDHTSEVPQQLPDSDGRLVLSDFTGAVDYIFPGGGWRGFSDRVMGGISNAQLESSQVDDKNCLRLSGNVTRESNGGFIQMAFFFGRDYTQFDASLYKGIELLTYGNNEDYNLHVRTADCRSYSDSYRMTFFAENKWARTQIPWSAFTPNRVSAPLDASSLRRIALVGWMREFEADIALAQIALYS